MYDIKRMLKDTELIGLDICYHSQSIVVSRDKFCTLYRLYYANYTIIVQQSLLYQMSTYFTLNI